MKMTHGEMMAAGWRQHKRLTYLWATPKGQLWTTKRNRFVKGSSRKGYLFYGSVNDGKSEYIGIHVLVWEAFNHVIEKGWKDGLRWEVHHKDSVRDNNENTNLELMRSDEHRRLTLKEGKPRVYTRSRKIRCTRLSTGEVTIYDSIQDVVDKVPKAIKRTIMAGCVSERSRYGCMWRWIEDPDLPGEYWASPYRQAWRTARVSNLGRISDSYGRKSFGSRDGEYTSVQIGAKHHGVHQVICEVFHGYGEEGQTPDHVDRDGNNNRLTNLRWADRLQQGDNMSHNRPGQLTDAFGKVVLSWKSHSDGARQLNIEPGRFRHMLQKGTLVKQLEGTAKAPQQRRFHGPKKLVDSNGEVVLEWNDRHHACSLLQISQSCFYKWMNEGTMLQNALERLKSL